MESVTSPSVNKTERRQAQILVPILLIAAVVFNVLVLLFGLRWIQQPFAGVLFYPRLVVSDAYNPNWDAAAQLQPRVDVLRRIDNIPVASGRDVFLQLVSKQPGEAVTLTFYSVSGAATDLTVTLTTFPTTDTLAFFWLPYSVGSVYLAFGIFLYRVYGRDPVAQLFAALCGFISIFASGLFDQYTYHYLTAIWTVFLPFAGASAIHFGLAYPVQPWSTRNTPLFQYVLYGVAAFIGLVNLYGLYLAPGPYVYTSIQLVNYGMLGASGLVFLALVLNTRATAVNAVVNRQVTIALGGSLLAFGPALLWLIATLLGADIALSLPVFIGISLALLMFPLSATYALLRYQVVDLDVAFSRGAAYVLITAGFVTAYVLLVGLLAFVLQDSTIFQNPILLAGFVVVLVISIEPLRHRLQTVIYRRVQDMPFDSRQLLQKYGQALIATPPDINHTLDLFLSHVEQTLEPEQAVIFLKDEAYEVFTSYRQLKPQDSAAVAIQFSVHDSLIKWLTKKDDILMLSPAGRELSTVDINSEELARLNVLGIKVCIPLRGPDALVGWVGLGLKKSGQPYASDDLLFLTTLASQTTISLVNANLLNEANQRATELEALQETSNKLQAASEPEQLLNMVVDQAMKLLHAEGALVLLAEPDRQTLKVVISKGFSQDYTNEIVSYESDLAAEVIKTNNAVMVEHYHGYTNRAELFQQADFGAVLAAPLRMEDEVGGVLYLIHRPLMGQFSPADIGVLRLFANQAAIAMEKLYLIQAARRRANQLAILGEVSTAISSTLDLNTALNRVMERAVHILDAEAGSLFLMNPQGTELTFEVVLGPTGQELLGASVGVGKGIVGTVAQTGQPLIINQVDQDPRWNTEFDESTQFRTRDILCVPMMTNNQVVGVIEVINKQDGSLFTEEERDLLLSFGGQAAIAIENAKQFTRTDQALAERVQELQTLQMFDQELQSSLELTKVLDVTLTRAMDALGVSMGLMGAIRPREEPGLYILVQRGMPMEMSRYKIDPWPLTRGIIGRVAQTGVPALIADIRNEPNYVPKNHRTRSLLVVPVLRDEKVIAVIDLESTDLDYFTEDDVNFIGLLASHAALAIQNAQLFDQVKEVNDAKTEFMSTASHELKIPMTSIKGYAKMLLSMAAAISPEQQKDFLKIIVGNVDRMDRLVLDLLDVSRIEANRIRLEIKDVHLQDVVEEVVESLRAQIEEKKQGLEVSLPPDLPQMRADYGRLIQILTNLLSNAYKYTPEGGDISVVVKNHHLNGDTAGVSVTVTDTGYGISEEDQQKLFTTFFRAGDQNIRDQPGTGLGLAITKKMIESHGGELSFASELGKGTSFTVTLPVISKIPPGVEVIEK